jgi:hypothetical protein
VIGRALRIAPRGSGCGILHSQGLTLVVLPKQWRQERRALLASTRGTVVCHELDTLIFPTSGGSEPDVDLVVDGLLGLDRGLFAGVDAPRIVEEVVCPNELPAAGDIARTEEALDALMSLLELSIRATHRWTSAPVLQSIGTHGATLDDPLATAHHAVMLQEMLRARHLTRLIEDRLRELRPTYATREERGRVVRGRLQTRSLFRAEATGEVDCEFEEFSEVSPLFRVVRTALDLVVGNSVHWGWLATLPFARQVLDAASAIRSRLHHISAMPRAEAARTASHLRLGRTLRCWEPVRALCTSILVDNRPGFGKKAAGGDGGSAFVVNTAALWQALVDHALRVIPGGQVEKQSPEGVQLWHGAPFRSKTVDSTIVFRGDRWLIDAKYKDFPDDGAPSLSDQYQMFGYSHLYDKVAHVGLVYPYPPQRKGSALSGAFLRGGRSASCSLRLASARFPGMHPSEDFDHYWARSLRDIGASLQAMLEGEAAETPAS